MVNTEELKELVADCPTLYHMAALGSWPSIRERGLLSTSALLDAYQVTGEERLSIEEERRGKSIVLKHEKLPSAVVRDQLPMTDGGLLRCLPKHISPADWYKLLNQKTFFWLTKNRLIRLLNAGTYRNEAHDVLEVCTQGLLDPYSDWRPKRAAGERVVEFAIDGGVPDISKYVTRVVEMHGNKEIRIIYARP